MSIRQRATIALSLAALAASVVAVPAAAAPHTWWVDDDGKAGPTSCDGTKTVSTTIAPAVAGASAGDTIAVCPGGYGETVTVATPNLTLRSVKRHGAVIKNPVVVVATSPAGAQPLVLITANGVKVIGFKVSMASTVGCTVRYGVGVSGADHAEIRSNQIVGRSDASSLSCGLTDGIILLSSDHGIIAGNSIRNYNLNAIELETSADATVSGNTVVWAHLVTTAAAAPAGAPGNPGVLVQNSRGATVQGNHLSVADASASSATGAGGIVIANGGGLFKDNVVRGFGYGLTAGYASKGTITGNTISKGASIGIYLYSELLPPQTKPFFTVTSNRVKGFGQDGIRVSIDGALITDNDFTGNPGLDCADDTTLGKNTWKRDLGDDWSKPGLCKKP